MRLLLPFLVCLSSVGSALAAFGAFTRLLVAANIANEKKVAGTIVSGSLLSVDTGGGLVWKARPTHLLCSSALADLSCLLTLQIHTGTGDIRSIVYSGKELQDQSKFSHIASGFGSATVTYKTVNSNYIVVTSQSTQIGGTITQ